MYDLSVESEKYLWFITTRTLNERLWFINNPILEYYILAFLAKYSKIYEVELYAFCLMGNHYHLLARFPKRNRASFLRCLNSIIAKLVSSYVSNYPGGKLWGRRAKVQAVPVTSCCIDTFLYSALNPTSTGLVKDPKDYPSYNSFNDAIENKVITFKMLNRSKYYKRKQYDVDAKKQDFIETYYLSFKRLPIYQNISQNQYKEIMLKKYEEKRKDLIKDRQDKGKNFPLVKKILKISAGAKPYQSKKSTKESKRPLILTRCYETKKEYLSWYFNIVEAFRNAASKFKNGIMHAVFPIGTYRPITCNL